MQIVKGSFVVLKNSLNSIQLNSSDYEDFSSGSFCSDFGESFILVRNLTNLIQFQVRSNSVKTPAVESIDDVILVQVAHLFVRDQLLTFIFNGFLVPVIGPALHQVSHTVFWILCYDRVV